MFRKRIVLCCAALCLTVTAGISLTACQNKSTDRSTSSENQDSISIESTSDDLGKYSVRISIGNAMDHPQAVGLTAMKEYVEEKTGGNVVIKIFPNSQLGAERESVEQDVYKRQPLHLVCHHNQIRKPTHFQRYSVPYFQT